MRVYKVKEVIKLLEADGWYHQSYKAAESWKKSK